MATQPYPRAMVVHYATFDSTRMRLSRYQNTRSYPPPPPYKPLMDNIRYAQLLEESAKLMQILGESSFRVRAFERAARTIQGLSTPIPELLDDGTITDIPGIGKGIAAELEEIRNTRSSENLERLRASLPADIDTLFQVSGLGPKRIRLIWEELGVGSIDTLEAAAKSGQLAGLKGLGPKTVANIIKEIKRVRASAGRTPFGPAYRAADEVLRTLRALPSVERVEVAGSLRRGRITVKDLDFVAASREPKTVMDAFISMPNVLEVVVNGDTKSTVILEGNLPADIRVVDPDVFGATLHHFTGSKDHNIKMRARAVARGLRISEYGVFQRDGDDNEAPLVCATEEEIFAAVGLPWIAPEMREDGGEIEAAERGELPDLIDLRAIRSDLHMHTTYSDGRATIEDMAEAAKALGLTHIAITDHSQSLYVANGLNRERLLAQIEEIDALNARLDGFRILKGLEVDILADGSLDMDLDVLEQLDWVVGSVHQWMSQSKEVMTERVIRAVRSGYISALGHPTGRLIGARNPYEIDLPPVLEACAEEGVAAEINAGPNRLDLDGSVVRKAQELEKLMFTINTDAHSVRSLHRMDLGVMTARRGWLPTSRVVNALALEDFLKTIRKPGAPRP